MPVASLVRMINQIATNQSHHSDEQAAADTAAHIRHYWTPLMRKDIVDHAESGGVDLDRVALMAVAILKDGSPSK